MGGRKWSEWSRKKRSIARGCTEETYDAAFNSRAIQEIVRQSPNRVWLTGPCICASLDLKHIRYFMVLVNLVVGGTMWETMRGWMLMEDIKRELSNSDQFHINRWLKNGIGPIETITIARIDDFFVYTSLCLCLYWVIFGLRVSWKYGAEEDLYCLLLGFPAILVLGLVEVYLSVVILRINQALSELDCEKLREVLSYNNLSMIVDLRNFMVAEGVSIAALFVTSAVVQVVTAALPFFLSDLPFQRRLYMDLFLFNDLTRTDSPVDINNNKLDEMARLNRQMAVVNYPSAALSLMLRLCRPEVREFHKRRQIVAVNPDLFNY